LQPPQGNVEGSALALSLDPAGYSIAAWRLNTRNLIASGLPAKVSEAKEIRFAYNPATSETKLWVNGQLVYDVVDPAAADGGLRPPQFGGIQFMWLWESLGWIDNVVVTDMR